MSLTDLVTGSDTGLTPEGITEAVSRYCEFDAALRGPRARSRHSVEHILERLVIRGEATTEELLMYFRKDEVHKPSQGRYAEYAEEQWFDNVAEPNLKALPCAENKGDTWAFSGIDSSEYDDEHTRSLDDLRDDPKLQAEQTLDDLGFSRWKGKRKFLLEFYSKLLEQGTATSDELDRVTHRVSFEDLEETFEQLPGVDREVNGPPEPEEIEIETYADVLEAQDLVSEPVTVEWTYVGN